MKPYVESGRVAQQRLESARPDRERVLAKLRGVRQVINTFGIASIVLIPALGAMADDSRITAGVAVYFLLIICGLELMERGVKRELATLDSRDNAPLGPCHGTAPRTGQVR